MYAITLIFNDGQRHEYSQLTMPDAEKLFDDYPRLSSVTIERV
jgi:hypothetical protein